MFGFGRRAAEARQVATLHTAVVESSRDPALFGEGALPDTVEGRFESLTLHALVVLRRLRQLPAPAAEVAQDLVDALFAHLEIALREMGVGDFGVPKRMKKLAEAFYHRTDRYSAALDAGSAPALSRELAERLGGEPERLTGVAEYALAAERALAACDLDQLVADLPFARLRERAEIARASA